jgi:hypothetical protein
MYYEIIFNKEKIWISRHFENAIKWALANSFSDLGEKEDFVYDIKYGDRLFEINSVFSADEADDLSSHIDNLVFNCCRDDYELKKMSDFFYKASQNGGFTVMA